MPSILLVEDDKQLLALLACAFRRCGFDVRTAVDGVSALASQTERAADLLVTDLIMPDCDGYELMKTFRLRWPRTPILAYTGAVETPLKRMLELALAYGADRVFAKPFDLDEMVHTAQSLAAVSEKIEHSGNRTLR